MFSGIKSLAPVIVNEDHSRISMKLISLQRYLDCTIDSWTSWEILSYINESKIFHTSDFYERIIFIQWDITDVVFDSWNWLSNWSNEIISGNISYILYLPSIARSLSLVFNLKSLSTREVQRKWNCELTSLRKLYYYWFMVAST